MQNMISTISMFHAIPAQVLSKDTHITSGACNTNHNVVLCCEFLQHCHLIIINSPPFSSTKEYLDLQVNKLGLELPILVNEMKGGSGVSGIITACPMVSSPRTSWAEVAFGKRQEILMTPPSCTPHPHQNQQVTVLVRAGGIDRGIVWQQRF